jgi:hypothetical protein
MTAVMSAANEKAVEIFLAERIGYLDIVPLVSACCEAHQQARPRRPALRRARGGRLAPRPLGPRHLEPHREETVVSEAAVTQHTFPASRRPPPALPSAQAPYRLPDARPRPRRT